ncbi:MAG: mandelate racemase/muconate lactonizing enzyme family protein [Alphaproteobacteria bacterium]|nr:mandelate racemase/muconate lactonizing enzyme family protein [Alphaproteobacteria bacterium]
MSRIASVETIHVAMPGDPTWSAGGTEDVLLVVVTDADGRQGIGECNTAPALTRAAIELPTLHKWSESLKGCLIGADPFEAPALWERMYQATLFHGRRGLGLHAISALDIALHDLAGKQLGRPVYALLGGARRTHCTPYATVFPGMPEGRGLAQLMAETERQFATAKRLGFRAVKMEVLFEGLADDRALADLIREGRRMLGDDTAMALDFGYRWSDWRDARWLLNRIADCDILFAEAVLQHDDLAGHAKLAGAIPMRLCGAEFAAGRDEILAWIRVGKVDVVQPNLTRAGGFTEMMRIAELCALEGVQLIPHGWNLGFGVIAGYHLQAAAPNVPYVEYRTHHLFPSPLRRDLASPADLPVSDGRVALPPGPGLGLTLDQEIVRRHRVAP